MAEVRRGNDGNTVLMKFSKINEFLKLSPVNELNWGALK